MHLSHILIVAISCIFSVFHDMSDVMSDVMSDDMSDVMSDDMSDEVRL